MFKIVVSKKHGTRKAVQGTTLQALREGIQDLRYDDHHLTMHAIDAKGASTFILGIQVIPDAKEGVEFQIYDNGGKVLG